MCRPHGKRALHTADTAGRSVSGSGGNECEQEATSSTSARRSQREERGAEAAAQRVLTHDQLVKEILGFSAWRGAAALDAPRAVCKQWQAAADR